MLRNRRGFLALTYPLWVFVGAAVITLAEFGGMLWEMAGRTDTRWF